jgi:hypothetical protein
MTKDKTKFWKVTLASRLSDRGVVRVKSRNGD